MSTIRNKQRLLHLYRFLMENTDEEHQVTTNKLVDYLKKEDANASRKTVKDDIEVLIQEGIDIVTTKSYYNSYFIGSRIFEVPEIKFLVDGIAANVSLSPDKKQKMIEKLLSLLSVYQIKKLKRNIHYSGDHGSASEQLYYSIDQITDAINENKKIEFQCYRYCFTGDRVAVNIGESSVLTPIIITCSNNRYYVLGYNGESSRIESVRLDRMVRTRILDEKGDPAPENFDMDTFLDNLFDMEVGDLTEVVLECDNDMMDIIADKFGVTADIWKSTTDRFYIKEMVYVSPAFYGWIFRYEGKIRIVSPIAVYNGYVEAVRRSLRKIKTNNGTSGRA